MKLFEILVPTLYGDTERPIRTVHHRNWDKYVMSLSGGITILQPGRGKWISETTTNLIAEKVIPVRVMCTPAIMDRIIAFTLTHYRQQAVMYYVVSSDVKIVYKEDQKELTKVTS